jgi:hypothetical protein
MGTPFGDLRIVRISGAALACANRLRARGRADRRDPGVVSDVRALDGVGA